MIPALDSRGLLPVGKHASTWVELQTYFSGDQRRLDLIVNAKRFALDILRHDFAGSPLFLAGSTFSDKSYPGDIEMTITVGLVQLIGGKLRQATDLQSKHNDIKATYEVDFYVSLGLPGANDFSEFFQYVGEKTAAVKHLHSKDKRGIIEVKKWTHG